MPLKVQTIEQVVDVSKWPVDDEYSPYPEGARSKDAYICPDDAVYSFLIPKHRYLFKESNPRYPEQYWVEIVAYLVGCYTKIPVPPTFVAYDSLNNKCGSLSEWFYGYPDEPVNSRYTMGGEFMTRIISQYDRQKGTKHNFRSIEILSKTLTQSQLLVGDYVSYWSKIFIFDALIGNTDRHQDNWGIVWYNSKDSSSPAEQIKAKFSPAFDNGTAMGHEILEENFYKFRDVFYLERYIDRGTYHMKWNKIDEERLNFKDFFVEIYELLFSLTKYNAGDIAL